MTILGIGIIAFLLFVLQKKIYKNFWDKKLSVSVLFSKEGISEGEEGQIIEIIENRKRLPLRMLKVRFQTSKYLGFADDAGSKTTDQYYRNDIFEIGGREKITRNLTFVGKKRGYYHIKNIDLVGSDIFLTEEMIKSMTTDGYLYVYPRCFRSEAFRYSLQNINGEVLVKRHMLEDPFEYRGIRQYQPFDDMRSINWKATARTGELKVNQRNYSAMQTIRIFLNLEDEGIWKKYKEVEAAMQLAMGISAFFLKQGISVSCYANGRDILTDAHMEIYKGAGPGQLDAIGKALARIDTEKKTLSFCHLFHDRILEENNSLYTFFISPNGYETYVDLLKECNSRGVDYCWYYPVTGTKEPDIPNEIKQWVQIIRLE